ncbi:hypothetical protein ACJ73_00320 [Blastomyces percursus]|uniref:Uncharacterized protein n=1 Tax=Blastomyces percursus TaxID=1658174 RepID=A0A1J9RJW5_9EURO|nr:hypothetical protein ACJ73_00320 [Blastomyces percursus]
MTQCSGCSPSSIAGRLLSDYAFRMNPKIQELLAELERERAERERERAELDQKDNGVKTRKLR